MGVWGEPHKACVKAGVPIIIVKENDTQVTDMFKSDVWTSAGGMVMVENYWEAAGYIMTMQADVHPAPVRRPLSETEVIK